MVDTISCQLVALMGRAGSTPVLILKSRRAIVGFLLFDRNVPETLCRIEAKRAGEGGGSPILSGFDTN